MRLINRLPATSTSPAASIPVDFVPSAAYPARRPVTIGWLRTARTALLAGLGRSWLWPWSLVAFLLRGGVVLFLVPILVMPSTVGVATFVGPMAVTAAGPTESFLVLVGAFLAVAAIWVLVGGLVAAWAERGLIVETLRGDGADAPAPAGVRATGLRPLVEILVVRLLAAVPLAVVLAWAGSRIVTVGYEELTAPGEVATPLPIRVLARVADALVVTAIVWLASEVAAGVATRRVLLRGESVVGALVFAVIEIARRPITSLLTTIVPLIGTIVLVGPSLVAVWIAWDRLRFAVQSGSVAGTIVMTILVVAIWSIGLVLAAAATAWRGAAWTFELIRTDPSPDSAAAGTPAAGDAELAPATTE